MIQVSVQAPVNQVRGGGAVVQEVKLLCALVLVWSIPGMVQQEEVMAVVNLGTAVRAGVTMSGEATVISLTVQARVLVER